MIVDLNWFHDGLLFKSLFIKKKKEKKNLIRLCEGSSSKSTVVSHCEVFF